MSKKRYLCIVGMSACLMAATLSGCSEKVTAESLMKEMQENIEEVNSYKASMCMEMEMAVEAEEESESIGMSMDMDIEMVQNPMMYYMGGSISVDPLGLSIDMENYGELKENEMVTYVGAFGEWQKSTTEVDAEETMNEMLELDAFIMDGKEMTLAEKTEKCNEKDVYVVGMTFTGEDLETIFEKMFASMSEEFGALDESEMEINYEDAAIDITYKIYKDSKLPAEISMSISENSEFSMSMEGVAMSFEKLDYDITYTEFDTIDSIEIPEEALNAEEADLSSEVPQDENGNYILTDYEDKMTVAIAPLEGYSISIYADTYNVAFELDTNSTDHTCYVSYCLTELTDDWTAEDMESSFKSYEELYTEENGYYDAKCSDVKTVKVGDYSAKYIITSYNMGDECLYAECNAWMVLDNGFAIECWFSEEYTDKDESVINENSVKLAMKAIK